MSLAFVTSRRKTGLKNRHTAKDMRKPSEKFMRTKGLDVHSVRFLNKQNRWIGFLPSFLSVYVCSIGDLFDLAFHCSSPNIYTFFRVWRCRNSLKKRDFIASEFSLLRYFRVSGELRILNIPNFPKNGYLRIFGRMNEYIEAICFSNRITFGQVSHKNRNNPRLCHS